MKIVTIVGARPQFIKCGAVSSELRQRHDEVLVHTGQHYDERMSDQFFRELNIPEPNYNFGIGSGSHATQTGAMMIAMEEVFHIERPDMALIYGDTNSTLAGALSAAKLHIPVAHVEAGLRSFNQRMPEEINRVVADHVSKLLFCPTQTAVDNLTRENILKGVHYSGDVMYDATLRFTPQLDEAHDLLTSLGLIPDQYYLATVHRADNTDDPKRLQDILEALSELEFPVAFPIHPRTRDALSRYGLDLKGNIRPLEPLGYRQMLAAQQYAYAVLTDSGGVQKEAYFLRTPCITLREETEWIETIEAGWNVLVGADRDAILHHSRSLPQGMADDKSHFGQGDASQKIAEALDDYGATIS